MADTLTQPRLAIPSELDDAMDAAWLQQVLAPLSGGAAVTWVGDIDNFETVAAKIRFAVRFGDDPGTKRHFCLKAFLGEKGKAAGGTAVREADFYLKLAPHLDVRVPTATAVIDREAVQAILIMDDLVTAGARFCSAFEPFTADMAANSLEQIARLHAGSALIGDNPWLPQRMETISTAPRFGVEKLQDLLNDNRGTTLDERTRDAALLLEGLKRLRDRFAGNRETILHGDCHAGNFYMTADGPGLTDWQLVQRGNWAQDVAYHIGAVLPVDVAEREERRLVDHYLEVLRGLGGHPPAREQAWEDYRAAQLYGFYHWAITVSTDPRLVDIFVERLGAGIARHDTYRLLGL